MQPPKCELRVVCHRKSELRVEAGKSVVLDRSDSSADKHYTDYDENIGESIHSVEHAPGQLDINEDGEVALSSETQILDFFDISDP